MDPLKLVKPWKRPISWDSTDTWWLGEYQWCPN